MLTSSVLVLDEDRPEAAVGIPCDKATISKLVSESLACLARDLSHYCKVFCCWSHTQEMDLNNVISISY